MEIKRTLTTVKWKGMPGRPPIVIAGDNPIGFDWGGTRRLLEKLGFGMVIVQTSRDSFGTTFIANMSCKFLFYPIKTILLSLMVRPFLS